jgi:tRNA-binding EMAP/Myf-like protein
MLRSARLATVEEFLSLDVRVGTVVSAEVNRGARKRAFVLRIDLGEHVLLMPERPVPDGGRVS